ncbi:20013_t:CDS:1 [Dentiscutata erythropus]|uniref:20013_t:CDS:1 n=1 Tax=Dentiscutata erythropus TaxID=1348616 RepID=A0A9N9FV99_9GLOM|nr:20013_t:CDS:1 [Dentiscutata erythropus]
METNNNSIVSSDSTSSQEISNIKAQINNKKFTSAVWNNFTLIKFADSSPNKAKCNHCEKRFSHKRSSGTSHLHRHLKTCKKYKITTARSSSLDDHHDKDNQIQYTSNQAKSWVYSEERSRTDLVNMIIRDKLSFQFVEHTGFLKFVSGLRPDFKVCSADTIKRDSLKFYQDRKDFVKNILQNIVS